MNLNFHPLKSTFVGMVAITSDQQNRGCGTGKNLKAKCEKMVLSWH
jgi:hypothetical protein